MQIRTGMRSSWLAAAAAVLVTGLLALLPSGCGGGGSETVPGPTPTPVGATPTPTPLRTAAFKVKIDWGARSRVIGLSSALSARITLEGGDPAGGDISWVVNRPAGTVAVLQNYDSPRPAKVGNFILKLRFYANADATGVDVGEATASATILADGSLTVTISTYTGFQSVELVSGQSVAVGQTKDLAFTARNFRDEVVAITTQLKGAAFLTVVANPTNLTVVDGGSYVTGLHPTQASVTVRVDNAVSAPAVVRVTSETAVSVSPASSSDLGSEFPLDLVATVTKAPAAESDVTWSIQGATGVDNGQLINVAGNTVTYVAPKLVDKQTRDVTVVATSKYNSEKTFSVPIRVTAPAVVEITPASLDLTWEEVVDLTAVVKNLSPRIPATGDARREVTWRIVPDGSNPVGSLVVDPANANRVTFTAPKRDTTVTVEATSKYDSAKIGVINILVKSKAAVTFITPNPLPQPLKVSVKQVQPVAVSLSGLPIGGLGTVTWTITGPNGEDNTGNIYGSIPATTNTATNYTAPANAPSSGLNLKLTATSNYDPRASKTINIQVIGGSLDVRID